MNLLKPVKRATSMVCAHFENKFHQNSRIILIWLLQDAICCCTDIISGLQIGLFLASSHLWKMLILFFFLKLMSKKETQVKWSEMENFRSKRWFFQVYKCHMQVMHYDLYILYVLELQGKFILETNPWNEEREADVCLSSPMKPIGLINFPTMN